MKLIKTTLNHELLMVLCSIIKNTTQQTKATESNNSNIVYFSLYHDLYYKLLKLIAKPHRVKSEILVKFKIHEAIILNDMIIDFIEDHDDIYMCNMLRKVHFDIDQQLPTLNQLNISV
ncbi:hypothetical protein [Flavobacteriaceae bacterium 14752]|uniref:hypothetical protein n=1 Tax=Mesohalobacter salilacus TaxID=2491711 RepID=UPI000F6443B1|nr:hypothetical protein EIG84_05835 [Flavobacteriaceae bacterium 14752]